MTVALAIRRMAPDLLQEVRAACRTLRLDTEEWSGGIPRLAPTLVITSLEEGARQVPNDVCALLDASPGLRAVVCTSEPLIRPRISLASGRLLLVSPPIDRSRLIAAIRASINDPTQATPSATGHRFEALRRNYWVAWARGDAGPSIAIDEDDGLTLSFGGPISDTIPKLIAGEVVDEAERADVPPFVHLSRDASEWVVYWPAPDRPIWFYSSKRIPRRWEGNLAAHRRLLRLGAFPDDQVLAGWGDEPLSADVFANLEDMIVDGASETLRGLASVAELRTTFAGLVVEIR